MATHDSTQDAAHALIAGRRSIRRYLSREVPATTLARVLSVATLAPSAHNRQPWRFAVVTDALRKERLASAMGHRLRMDRRRDGDDERAIDADVARSHARITTAPVVIVVCVTLEDMDRYPDDRRQHAEYLMATQSTAMAVQNLLLAAHAEGLGACWMCAPLFCPDIVGAALDLSPHWEPQALVTLGYPADGGKPFSRRPLDDVVRFVSGA
jgi:F420 biosynthesis protein FbiB-like protein